jgi:prepilin peptidase CpaA
MFFLQMKIVLLFMFLFVALYSDTKMRKIKNNLIITFVFSGILINIGEQGWAGLLLSLKGIVLPIFLLILFFKLKMLGAGDIKLFSGIGAYMGPVFLLEAMLYSFLAGGIIATFLIIIRKNARQRFTYLFTYIKTCFISFSLLPYGRSGNNNGAKFPFAWAVISGVGLQLLLNEVICGKF